MSRISLRIALLTAFLVASGAPLIVFWLWPHSAALRGEMETLIGAAMGVAARNASESNERCRGETAFVEVAMDGLATSHTRACVSANEPVGRLALRLSEVAGSRTDEELNAAAIEEVMAADRAFAALADCAVLQVASSDPQAVLAVGAAQGSRRVVLVANLTGQPRTVRIAGFEGAFVEVMDEQVGGQFGAPDVGPLVLRAFAVARLVA